ncbi:MAG: sigma-70 family RNA polymerase sigma factor [Bacteroidales bacterium]|nr:sigma-70 family RNA polymerase sigma factor [Bacteroidales bacterium]
MDILEENKNGIKSICHFYASMSSVLSEEDVFQEVVYNVLKGFKRYEKRKDCKTSTWVYRVAINVSISLMRKENRATFSTLEEIPVESEICEDEIDKEGIEYLYSVIKNLDVEEQSLIFLYLDGKSYKEISEILGISVSNVGTRLQRVKSKLRKISNENL